MSCSTIAMQMSSSLPSMPLASRASGTRCGSAPSSVSSACVRTSFDLERKKLVGSFFQSTLMLWEACVSDSLREALQRGSWPIARQLSRKRNRRLVASMICSSKPSSSMPHFLKRKSASPNEAVGRIWKGVSPKKAQLIQIKLKKAFCSKLGKRPLFMLALLDGWLHSQGCSFSEKLALSSAQGRWELTAAAPLLEGEPLFSLHQQSLLTAPKVFADREFGEALRSLSLRVGPGFDSVALSAFLAAERVRGFRGETWFAGSSGQAKASFWSPLTRAYWTRAEQQPVEVAAETSPLVAQGVELLLPILELAARRAWIPGEGDEWRQQMDALFGDEWKEKKLVDSSRGWSRADLEGVLWEAFAIVLDAQVLQPPNFFSQADCLTDETSTRWGWREDAPSGVALLPPLDGEYHGDRPLGTSTKASI
ncbi:MAG: hypothetical protein SGPRY_009637 [Prymnesium sp.]